MSEITQEQLVELAFATANRETLSSAMRDLSLAVSKNESARTRLEEYMRLISSLKSAYAMAPATEADPALDDEMLAAYVDGLLQPADQDIVERVLATNSYWFRQYISLKDVLQEVDNGETPLRIIVRLAQQGLQWISAPAQGFQPRLAGQPAMLGSEDPVKSLLWTQYAGEWVLSGALHYHHPATVDLSVTITAPDIVPVPFRLSLYRDDRLVESRMHDGRDSVRFLMLKPDVYRLSVEIDNDSLAAFEIAVDS